MASSKTRSVSSSLTVKSRSARVGVSRAGAGPPFPVVALGGSAGALDAYERFFGQLPAACGLALVVVQHLPSYEPSALAELLRGYTKLPVLEITDGLVLCTDHVYVAPPDLDVSLLHGTFLLLPPTLPAAQRLPVDFFFQSLAKDARERAVCVILSGAGSDGALGLKLVMENFGIVMVQDPTTAAHDAMPRAALATEFVDFVLPPELMPAQLLDYVARLEQQRLPRRAGTTAAAANPEALPGAAGSRPAHALQKVFLLIRQQTGHDFSLYKRNTMLRRIERRMNAHQFREMGHYVRYLQGNPGEVLLLFKELLIGVTKFFRDPDAYDSLKPHLKELLATRPVGSSFRVWAAGCSTGEETYSLAIVLRECLLELGPEHRLRLQIFATDLNADGVNFARHGLYPVNIEADVSPARLAANFTHTDEGYQINKELRDTIVFAVHNLNRDAPFTRLDLVVCRNLLIYLSTELQRNLLPVFHYALQPAGLLFLGPSESLGGLSELFEPLDAKWKIARRRELSAPLLPLASFFPLTPAPLPVGRNGLSGNAVFPTGAAPRREAGSFATLVQQQLLLHYAPPAVVINGKGEILFVHGRTGKYLEPTPGLGTLNLFDMARDGLSVELSGAVHRALQSRADVLLDGVRVHTDAGPQRLRPCVRYLHEPETLAGLLLITFDEQAAPSPRRRGPKTTAMPAEEERDALVAALDRELQFTKHRLQSTVEEMEGSLEELKSTNEELQSANKELQSTNEETMTNREEMQSLNEELMTLNAAYQTKSEELSQLAANDLRNLLDATEVAMLFVDNELLIRRFTASVKRVLPLVPGDEGRPLAHFAPHLRRDTLPADTQQVLDRLLVHESQVQTTAGEWFSLRIMPYRTLDNYISGAILTFTDIQRLKALEARLQASTRLAQSVAAAVREPVLVLDPDLRVLSLNLAFAALFGLDETAAQGQPLAALSGGAWQQLAVHQQLLGLLAPGAPATLDGLVVEADFGAVGRRRLHLYARRLPMGEDGEPVGLLLGVEEME